MKTMLDFALMYLAKGVSVMPVQINKKPYLSTWKEFQSRLPTESEVREWWTKWPEANIAIITGRVSGIAVVDVEKGGDISKFPTTDTVKTGGGGWHFYYKYHEGIENKVRTLPLTDIRGEGGYVVAPPSIHSSGQKYIATEAVGKTDFPAWLFGETRQKTDWQTIVEGVGHGNRNETASKLCGKLLRTFAPSEWESAWLMLLSWNKSNNPPLSEYELRNVFNSISKRELKVRGEVVEKTIGKPLTFTEVLDWGIQELEATNPKEVISFGYQWLDDQMTGFFKSELVVIGGETGLGKTTFATNIIYKASKLVKCSIFALEDRLPYYGQKALFFEINRIRIEDKKIMPYMWNDFKRNAITDPKYKEYVQKARENLKNDNLFFEQIDEMMDIDTLEKIITKRCEENFELFLLDHLHYLDLLRTDKTKADYIEHLMVRIKKLLNNTGARLLLVVHYRKLNGQKPGLDSFKDSAAIAQNANYVINMWRDRKEQADRYTTLITLPKTRNPNGEATIQVTFDPATNDFGKPNAPANDIKFGVGDSENIKQDQIDLEQQTL